MQWEVLCTSTFATTPKSLVCSSELTYSFCSGDHVFLFKAHWQRSIGPYRHKLSSHLRLCLSSCVAPLFHSEINTNYLFIFASVVCDENHQHTLLLVVNPMEDLLLCSHIGSSGHSADVSPGDGPEKVRRKSGSSHSDILVHTYSSSTECQWSSVHVWKQLKYIALQRQPPKDVASE